MKTRSSLTLAAFLIANASVQATLTLDLPNLILQPNQSGQTFTIAVQNSAPINLTGVQLELAVTIGGPQITAVTLISSGLLFQPNNTGDAGNGSFAPAFPHLFQRLTSTSSGPINLSPGTYNLAEITFDTTGLGPGSYTWSPSTSPNGASFFTGTGGNPVITPDLFDGNLEVVPEPATIYAGLFLAACVAADGVRRQIQRRKIQSQSKPRLQAG